MSYIIYQSLNLSPNIQLILRIHEMLAVMGCGSSLTNYVGKLIEVRTNLNAQRDWPLLNCTWLVTSYCPLMEKINNNGKLDGSNLAAKMKQFEDRDPFSIIPFFSTMNGQQLGFLILLNGCGSQLVIRVDGWLKNMFNMMFQNYSCPPHLT